MDSSTGKLDYIGRIKKAVDECEGLGLDLLVPIMDKYNIHAAPITVWGPMVWSAPVLHPSECLELRKIAEDYEHSFSPNNQEGKDYRIDELILLTISKEIYDRYSFLAHHRLGPLFQLMMGMKPERASSIQLARFRPGAVTYTDWHTDLESEMTCVISLAPELHEGGGTALRPWGPTGRSIYVPPLPMGHGLFFNGRLVYHKAEPIEKGERLLLVFWMMGGGLAQNGATTL